MQSIAKSEDVKISEDVLYEIARHSEGCARDAESLLGQLLALGEKEISLEEASLVLPVAYTDSVLNFVEALAKNESAVAIRVLNEGVEQGMDVASFIDNVVSLLRTILFAKLGGLERFQEAYEESILKRVGLLAATWGSVVLTNIIDNFLTARRSVKTDIIPQLAAELAVIKVCCGSVIEVVENKPIAVVAQAKIERLENTIKPESSKPAPVKIESAVVEEVKSFLPYREIMPEEIRKNWDEMCNRVQEKNPSLLLVLKNGNITKAKGSQIEVEFGYALHAETVNRAKNKKSIDEILSDLLGAPVSVMAVHVPHEAVADETAAMLAEAFGGSTV